jgi:hypothetical protein
MDHHKHHTPLSIIIILFAIILGAIYLVKEDGVSEKPKVTTNDTQNPVVVQPTYKCGMTVNGPLVNSTVAFPLVVTGIINNSTANDGCTWVLFEGQGGTVTLSSGATTYAVVPTMIAGDWMTNGPVAFSATLSPQSPIPSGAPLTLTFSEENPSGEGISDTFSYQVIAQ